ncbi:MAG: hypothetical protein WA919_29585 [Coleofasciculaceae cyanobacterium]
MNINRIIFSAVVTGIVGLILGISLAEINRGDRNPQAHSQYGTIGAIMGLAVGAGQEALREIKKQKETE